MIHLWCKCQVVYIVVETESLDGVSCDNLSSYILTSLLRLYFSRFH